MGEQELAKEIIDLARSPRVQTHKEEMFLRIGEKTMQLAELVGEVECVKMLTNAAKEGSLLN